MIDECLFQKLLDTVHEEAIYMIDPRGRVLTWSRGAERLKGYVPRDVIGRSIEMFYTTEDIVRGLPYDELAIAEREDYFEATGWRVVAGGRAIRAHTSLTPIRVDGTLIGFARQTRELGPCR